MSWTMAIHEIFSAFTKWQLYVVPFINLDENMLVFTYLQRIELAELQYNDHP
jgi:hypothetical protein